MTFSITKQRRQKTQMEKVDFILIVICFYKWIENWNKIFVCYLLQIWDAFPLKRNPVKALHWNQFLMEVPKYTLLNQGKSQDHQSLVLKKIHMKLSKPHSMPLPITMTNISMNVSPNILELRSNVQPSLHELDHPQNNPKKPSLS